LPRFPPALRHRRYRLLWLGLIISVAGTQMQTAAILWHVNQLNPQPIALGGVGLARILPFLLFSLVAGVAADVWNRRRILFITQSALALFALVLAGMTIAGNDTLALVYVLVALTGAIATFDLPARQSLIPNLVPAEDLSNAFSLNAIAYQVGAIVGPALAGLVLATAGIAYCYLVNAVSYLAVIVALALMGPVPQRPVEHVEGGFGPRALVNAVREGLRFVLRERLIFSSMLLDFFATFFSSATALMPIFAREILDVGAVGYGWLIAAPAVGALGTALVLSTSGPVRHQGRLLLITVTGFGMATIVFGLSQSFVLTFAALVVTGVTDSISTIIRNTIRQLRTPDALRGRMTSVNQIFFLGGPQLGELEAGIVAQIWGPVVAVVSGGVGCLAAVAWTRSRYPEIERCRGWTSPAAASAPRLDLLTFSPHLGSRRARLAPLSALTACPSAV
jgi:MFS family permease